jgi:hypothetical protein
MLNKAVLPFSTTQSSVVHPRTIVWDSCLNGAPLTAVSIPASFCHSGCSRTHSTMWMCFSSGQPQPNLHPPGLLRVCKSPCSIRNLVPKSTGVAIPILNVSHTSAQFMDSHRASRSSTGRRPSSSHVGRLVVLSTRCAVHISVIEPNKIVIVNR